MEYITIGRTQFPINDLKGKSKEEIESKYSYLHPRVVSELVKAVSPKKTVDTEKKGAKSGSKPVRNKS